jgi:hypothetical protein
MKAASGLGIPRLQELDFLLVAHAAAARGATFEAVRLALIDHMASARAHDAGTGNNATFQLARENKFRYVSNAADALKELMRLGLLEPASLPSESKAAPHYAKATFKATAEGERWAALVETDRVASYDELVTRLWNAHPHFAGYLRVLRSDGLTIPLAQWTDMPEPRSRERFVDLLVERVATGVADGRTGWQATSDEIRRGIASYMAARIAFATNRQRPEPYPRNQDFINACEEALVKLAFASAGVPLDYITHEVLRRWMRVLGLANFSYYVPGRDALRLWPTAEIDDDEQPLMVRRHVGEEYRDQAVAILGEAYEQVRRSDRMTSSWVPIYRVRAAVCWRLRISDALFDRAFVEFLRGERGVGAPFAANVDPAQYGNVPPSERGLQVDTKRGLQTYYSMSLIPRKERIAR